MKVLYIGGTGEVSYACVQAGAGGGPGGGVGGGRMRVLYMGGTGEISYGCVRAGGRAGQDVTVSTRGGSEEPLPAGVKWIGGEMNDETYRGLGGRGFDVVCQFLA